MGDKVDNIIIIEPNMNSIPHSEINAGFLVLIESVFESNNYTFIADKRHSNAIQELTNLDKWNIVDSKVFNYTPFFFLINELILIYKIIRLYLKSSKRDKFFFLGIMPIAHIFLSFLNEFFQREIFICLHGQMEAFIDGTKIGKTKYYYRLSKFVFKRKDAIDYIIFGESIKANLLFLFNKKKRLISIDQPYLYNENQRLLSREKPPYVLGFVGRFDKTKNVKDFFVFIESLKEELLTNKIQIKIVGKVNFDIKTEYLNLFSFYSEILSKVEFENEIKKLDFVISFINDDYYKATPSGAFFDCMKWEIPILTLENDFVNYYFDHYGRIGEKFSNSVEMSNFVKSNLIDKTFDFGYYISAINEMKESISVNNLKYKFIDQL
ncbi:hypothetical protein [Flavobacterium sp. 3-210]